MRECRLQRVEAVVQLQQGMSTNGDDRRLILDGQERGARLFQTCWQVRDRAAFLPLRHRLLIDAIAQRALDYLYRSTDCLCRCGAPVKNLDHSASFHSW